jgi:hypothetical protein
MPVQFSNVPFVGRMCEVGSSPHDTAHRGDSQVSEAMLSQRSLADCAPCLGLDYAGKLNSSALLAWQCQVRAGSLGTRLLCVGQRCANVWTTWSLTASNPTCVQTASSHHQVMMALNLRPAIWCWKSCGGCMSTKIVMSVIPLAVVVTVGDLLGFRLAAECQ